MDAVRPLPSGVGVALVTFFGEDGRVDLKATAARARRCVELGISAVLVAGTTGEAARLSVHDRVELASAAKDAAPGIPVIVGTGHPDADAALEATARIALEGDADAVLAYCPNEAEPASFFRAVRDEARGRSVLAYHNPALAARKLGTQELPSLDVDGVKDSSGSSNRLADLVELGVRVYVGSPTQLALAGPCGAAGALLALANVAPTDCIAAWNGDVIAQRRLFALHRRAAHGFPAYLKHTAPE
ncbi:MAG TPA: dihydrodipicolinate synthase family protein [Acidimicrobiales bacterium]|nr:dihydrodipicolinate synthase family protein [Acidimicrobiales bacterium]